MLLLLLTNFVILVLSFVFQIFPVVVLADIPIIGPSFSSTLTTAVLYFNSFAETLPYIRVVMDMFLFVVLPTEFLILILKFFLGSRTPISNNN